MKIQIYSVCAGCGKPSETTSGFPPITWVKCADGKWRCHECLGITAWEAIRHEPS